MPANFPVCFLLLIFAEWPFSGEWVEVSSSLSLWSEGYPVSSKLIGFCVLICRSIDWRLLWGKLDLLHRAMIKGICGKWQVAL